jgi:hypothetical protein
MNFLQDTQAQNSDIVSSYLAGTTVENRQLRVLVINTSKAKKSLWIDCGIHAVSSTKTTKILLFRLIYILVFL